MADRILLRTVNPKLRYVDGTVKTNGDLHRVGHLPNEGWFCLCDAGTRCPHIDTIRDLVPPMEQP